MKMHETRIGRHNMQSAFGIRLDRFISHFSQLHFSFWQVLERKKTLFARLLCTLKEAVTDGTRKTGQNYTSLT